MTMQDRGQRTRDSFTSAGAGKEAGLLRELFVFMKHNKKFWLAPIIIVLLAMSGLILPGGTAAAPFIYTLF